MIQNLVVEAEEDLYLCLVHLSPLCQGPGLITPSYSLTAHSTPLDLASDQNSTPHGSLTIDSGLRVLRCVQKLQEGVSKCSGVAALITFVALHCQQTQGHCLCRLGSYLPAHSHLKHLLLKKSAVRRYPSSCTHLLHLANVALSLIDVDLLMLNNSLSIYYCYQRERLTKLVCVVTTWVSI